jgi:hypothetical protein
MGSRSLGMLHTPGTRAALRRSLLLLFALPLGCAPLGDSDSAFGTGNLGQSTFYYTCIDAADAACAGRTSDAATLGGADAGTTSSEIGAAGVDAPVFPLAIAVGSTFRLTYAGATSTADPTDVGAALFKTVANQYLQPIASGPSDFRVLAPGYGGVYIESTADSELVDYTLLHLVTVETLSIGDANLTPLTSSAFLAAGTPTVFTVTPIYQQTAVAGALDLEWSLDDPTVATLTTPNPTARMTVKPLKAGTTSLHVTGAGLSASIAVEVSP